MRREDRFNNNQDVEEYIHRVTLLIGELQSVKQKLIEVNNDLDDIYRTGRVYRLQEFYADAIRKIEDMICQNEKLLRRLEQIQENIERLSAECRVSFLMEENIVKEQKVSVDKVGFSAIAPKRLVRGEYFIINIVMYEDEFRNIVDEIIKDADEDVQETKVGTARVESNANVKVVLTSPDFEICDNVEERVWQGEYLNLNFAVELPEDYSKKQILFIAIVYIDDMITTRLKFIAKCESTERQKIEVTREAILSAFVSYASQDRNRVAMIIQGMQKARPDIDVFFDVESLRSGDDWEKTLWAEIDKRDILFLCWSRFARESQWVEAEWKYALEKKGIDYIEPVPIDPPAVCPPPEELKKKHFNDKLLYIISAENE